MQCDCHILLVEDDPGDANLVRQLLRKSQDPAFEVKWVETLADAKHHLTEQQPDLLLLDLSLPDSQGIETVHAMRQAAGGLPIIVLTGRDDTAFALQILELGAQDYLIKGRFDQDALVRAIRYAISRSRLEQHLQESEARFRNLADGAPVLMWESDVEQRCTWLNKTWLGFTGRTLEQELGMGWMEGVHPDDRAAVSEEYAACFAAHRPIRIEYRLRRSDGEYRWVIAYGSPRLEPHNQLVGYIGMCMDITERHLMQQELQHQAHVDYLTGLNNRRYFIELGEAELARAIRYGSTLSMLMLDIDFFKKVNDTYGHKTGDAVLQKLGQICRETLREIDLPARIGGEEFAILLPETSGEKAVEVAERLRQTIADTPVPLEHGLPLHFTVSIGVATYTGDHINIDMLLNLADQALYQAKNSGRNRVVAVTATGVSQ